MEEIILNDSIDTAGLEEELSKYLRERRIFVNDSKWEKESEIREALKSGVEKGFFGTLAGQPVGFILFRENNAVLQITHFYVSADLRKKGAGRKLLEKVREYLLQRKDLNKIFCVFLPNLVGLTIEEMTNMGFKPYERLIMERLLTEEVVPPVLSGNFKIAIINDQYLWQLAEVLHLVSKDGIDKEIRPGVFETPWTCFLFLRQVVKGYYGVFAYHTSFLLCEKERILGGIFGTYRLKGEAFIPAFFIHNDYQGKGLGRRLLDTLLKKLKECGTLKVSLCVTATNNQACGFYKRNGFSVSMRYYEVIYKKPPV